MTYEDKGPLDRQIIEELRRRVDAHAHEPYAWVEHQINWDWYHRAVLAMEKGLLYDKAVKEGRISDE